jgi:hypothetical protein
MVIYYKAVRPDGKDFATGTIDYASALGTDQAVKHPAPQRKSDYAWNYLSISTSAGDCTGFVWDEKLGARLFEVKPVGVPWTPHPGNMPNKRAVTGVRILRELPNHMLFGPQGEAIVDILGAFRKLTSAQRSNLYLSRPSDWYSAWSVVYDGRASQAGLEAARYALYDRLSDFGGVDVASCGAALAVLLRHTIGKDGFTQAHYEALTKPWVVVTGQKAHSEDVMF